MKLTFGLSCPSCGGRIDVEEGDHLAICPFCHTVSKIEGEDDVKTLAYALVVDEKKALEAAHKWFKHGFKARDLKEVGKIKEIYHVYLPFWRYTAKGLGVVCGYNYRTDSRGNTEKVYKEKEIMKDYDWSHIACDAGDIGIMHLRNYRGEVVPLPEDAPTFEVTTSKDDAVDMGVQEISKRIVKEAQIQNITFSKTFVVPRHFVLLYYPVWIIRYEYKDKMYFLTVDGVTGQVLSGRAPGDSVWQGLAIATGSTVGGVLVGLALPAMQYVDARAGLFLLIIGGIIFLGAYSFFRHGSEIVEGDIEKPYKGVDIPYLKGVLKWA
ncbi:MAG: hypothetical protein GXO25_01270 [Euryarchaeota archaeon]|nr:hypothetical protein [Euryarchaeota archaeon]